MKRMTIGVVLLLAGVAASEYLAMEEIKGGAKVSGAIYRKYADEYIEMFGRID